jgi:hypothetical protein
MGNIIFLAWGAFALWWVWKRQDTGQSSSAFLAMCRDALPPERQHEAGLIRFGKSKGWRQHVRRAKATR